ncbi:MAG: nuclear transport factor 2 family protein [Pseudobdellovibrio sp.]
MPHLKDKIIKTFNSFDGTNLEHLNSFYSNEIIFEDPITKVIGLTNLKKYYAHAYKNVKSIRFDFSNIISDHLTYGASWEMHLCAKGLNQGNEFAVPGFTLLKFNDNELVSEHRDYFDLGAMVYEKLPIQGIIINTLKKFLK